MKQTKKEWTVIFNYSSEMKTININPSWNSNYDNNTIYNIVLQYDAHKKLVPLHHFKCAYIGA